MRIDIDRIDLRLTELRELNEKDLGFQPEAVLGCFRSKDLLYDYWCKKHCKNYEVTCVKYLKHFDIEGLRR